MKSLVYLVVVLLLLDGCTTNRMEAQLSNEQVVNMMIASLRAKYAGLADFTDNPNYPRLDWAPAKVDGAYGFTIDPEETTLVHCLYDVESKQVVVTRELKFPTVTDSRRRMTEFYARASQELARRYNIIPQMGDFRVETTAYARYFSASVVDSTKTEQVLCITEGLDGAFEYCIITR